MINRKVYLIAFLLFVICFLIATMWQIISKLPLEINIGAYYICRYNLKVIWILSQRISRRYQVSFPPPVELVKLTMNKPILLTEREANYLGTSSEWIGAYVDFPLSLICPRDPKYLLKVAMDSQGLDYEPSYIWHPDNRTLAYCPYCRLAVLLDGKIERR